MSEWWVKEQARRGRIPFTKPGRAYRFTAEQYAEIIRLLETRPAAVSVPQSCQPMARPVPIVAQQTAAPTAAVRLRARTPRRAQQSEAQSSAA
ncbi:DNA-binding protein [Kitasatospora sp. P5_F3]